MYAVGTQSERSDQVRTRTPEPSDLDRRRQRATPATWWSATRDGVTVIERDKAASLLPLAAEKVADETKRIADIKSRKALRPGWLDAALRAAGVLKEGETL